MPKSVTGRTDRLPGNTGRGFTLLEILVVMVIVGVLIGFAALRLRDADPTAQIEQQMRTLTALIEARCEQSVIQARNLGLRLVPGGYDFWVPYDYEWIPDPDTQGPFRPRTFSVSVDLVLIMDGQTVPVDDDRLQPQLQCLPGGELTPFVLEVESGGRTVATLEGSLNGKTEMEVFR